jgi:hypothetical protein
MKTEQVLIGWGFGLRWVLLTMAGWVLGFPLGFALGELGLGYMGLEIGFVAVVGLMQWLVLRRAIRHAGIWMLLGILGFAVSAGIHAIAMYTFKCPEDLGTWQGLLGWTVVFVAGGTLAGVMQQRILRRQVHGSGFWVPASAAGWGRGIIGLAIPFLVLPVMRDGPAVMLIVRNMVVPAVLGSVLLGTVTGGVLIWLLRQPIAENEILKVKN